ncbi:MAG: sodium:proton exchanger [Campylobacterota bacterium]|nr:sodium:proton exchanger [Campylobacterota bacterium]
MEDSSRQNETSNLLDDYWDIIIGLTSIVLAILLHKSGYTSLSTLFAAIGIGALSLTVSEVAEIISERLQEPYGSFVLTFSAVIVEIILLYIILLQAYGNPDVIETVKGGIISAVIVDMNVLLGLAVFLGGLKFREQDHNKETSSAYTTILFVTGVALLVPSLLNESRHATEVVAKVSYIIAGLLMVFYIFIIIFQTKTHTHFFKQTARSRMFKIRNKSDEDDYDDEHNNSYIFDRFNNMGNFISIFVLIAIIAIGAEVFATDGIIIAKEYGISPALSGLFIAIVAVAPEIATAIKAAKNDEIQRVVNIAMGASTVSILLTVPVLLALAYMSGINLMLDFNTLEIGALILTIILAWKTTDEGHTNYFEGISHLMFFAAFAIIAAYY